MNSTQTLIKNLSIKNKLTILGMLTSLISILTICSGFLIFITYEEKSEIIDEIRFIGKLLSEDLAEDVVNIIQDRDLNNGRTNLLRSLKYRGYIDLACVVTLSGEKIASYSPIAIDDLCNKLPKISNNFDFVNNENFKNNLIVKSNIRKGG